jgi:hypothetical protein
MHHPVITEDANGYLLHSLFSIGYSNKTYRVLILSHNHEYTFPLRCMYEDGIDHRVGIQQLTSVVWTMSDPLLCVKHRTIPGKEYTF